MLHLMAFRAECDSGTNAVRGVFEGAKDIA